VMVAREGAVMAALQSTAHTRCISSLPSLSDTQMLVRLHERSVIRDNASEGSSTAH
jgi:hypothetical protein